MPSQPYQARVVGASLIFAKQPFAKPLVLSSGEIREITQVTAKVKVRVGKTEATGVGVIYLSDVWSWPDPKLAHPERDAAMRLYCESIANRLAELSDTPQHPLELGMRLHQLVQRDTPPKKVVAAYPPLLARLVCASPFDAAIHDAVGMALDRSAMRLYDVAHSAPAADKLFGGKNGAACKAIQETMLGTPRDRCTAWWVVGKKDDLSIDIHPAIVNHGYHAFKLKTHGQSPEEDAKWTVDLFRYIRSSGVSKVRFCIDSNCGNPDAASVLKYLSAVEALDAHAYDAIELVEQPTARDIAEHAFDWKPVAAKKPVVVDEGLTGIDAMQTAREQGWSGLAIKTCKGHSFALVGAAWARLNGMSYCLQDLTNPGIAAVHSAMLAAYLPTSNGMELNSVQFTPAANANCVRQIPQLFDVHKGQHGLPGPQVPGLGACLATHL